MSDSPSTVDDRSHTAEGVRILWWITRIMTLVIGVTFESRAGTDLRYYFEELKELPTAGIGATMPEYPLPAVGYLGIPSFFGSEGGYFIGITVLALVIDVLFTALLFRADGGRRGPGTTFWLVFVPLAGPIVYNRFDLLPAVLTAAAIFYLSSRPAVAGVLLGAGVAIKMWPAALLPVLLARPGGRARVLGGFAAVGVVALAGSAVAARNDLSRIWSPLNYQSDRGLQVESIWATPTMVARAFDPDRWELGFGFLAYDVSGPGTAATLTVADVASLLAVLVVLVLAVRAARHRHDAEALAICAVAVVVMIIVTGKTFSPQYLHWLAAPLAVALALGGRHRVALKWLGVMGLVAALLSHVLYPWVYSFMLEGGGSPLNVLALTVLVARNGLVVVFAFLAVRLAWRATAAPGRVVAEG